MIIIIIIIMITTFVIILTILTIVIIIIIIIICLGWPSAGLLLNSYDQHNLTGMVANVLDPTVMEIRETVGELIKTSS